MRAVEENGDWYLFCPHDIKKAGLKPFYEIYGKEYEEEYNKAVEMGLGTKIKAHDLWLKIIESQIETGMPYMCFKDHANEKSNQKNMGVIHSSNLCSEIMEVTDAKTTAICTLTSIPVQKFVIDGEYNFEELGRVTRSITKSLNIAIDVNEYSTEEGRKGGLEQRALGIGIQGLADVFALLKLKFTSEESRKLNKDIFETIYFNALRQSCDLAKETGLTYDGYEGSPLSEGIFQWQMWGLKDEDLSGMFDWKQLRKDIKKYGVRNSLVTTCPPTASCQVIDTRIHTENGVKSFKEILIENDIDYETLEKYNQQQWLSFDKPFNVKTQNGYEEVTKIKYNGHSEVYKIEMEDGSIFEATTNHQFKVKRDNLEIWVKVEDLLTTDDIVNIFEK
jgi:ribonucleoside-diphosphate reductase alpha chain